MVALLNEVNIIGVNLVNNFECLLVGTARFPDLNIFVFGCLLLPYRRVIDLLLPRRRVVSSKP